MAFTLSTFSRSVNPQCEIRAFARFECVRGSRCRAGCSRTLSSRLPLQYSSLALKLMRMGVRALAPLFPVGEGLGVGAYDRSGVYEGGSLAGKDCLDARLTSSCCASPPADPVVEDWLPLNCPPLVLVSPPVPPVTP